MTKICTFILRSKTKLKYFKMFKFALHFKNIYLLTKMHTAANRPKNLSGGRRVGPREGLPLQPQHR